ncbi:metal-dependent hydrolase family protein [Flavimarina sp. Hel_I_48]|uniref:metal-dependent hydrolase family protein n=1 Tax=Flavimarina sp. Hel_I_48 TaxID=1392488 RepID=UPI0004DFC4E0|nr:amidohydrolase family protein [Flavimarina sp. Hel_I_48]
MKNHYTFLILFFLALSVSAQDTYLHCGKLIDTEAGKVLKEKTIIVSKGKIKEVRDGYVPAKNDQDSVVDLKTETVMPGLIDMHVHIEGETNPNRYLEPFTLNDADVAYNAQAIAERTLMAGFTTVRDLGGSGINVSLRNAINADKVTGPRIFTAEKTIGSTGGHADPTNGYSKELMGNPGPKEGVVNSVDDARKAVRQRYKNGADWIKITATGGVLSVAKNGQNPQFTEEEIKAITTTAADYGMQVAAHAHGDEGMQRAIKNGVKTIEHGTLMSEETMNLMKEYDTFYIPTLSAGKYVAEKAKIDGYYPAIIVPKALAIGPQLEKTFAKAYKKGVSIGFGTDAGVFPHGENAKEFGYMVEADMPAMQSLQSATSVNAKLLRQDDNIGAIKSGLMADIIALKEDPTQNIDTMNEVVFVMKNGVVYKNE